MRALRCALKATAGVFTSLPNGFLLFCPSSLFDEVRCALDFGHAMLREHVARGSLGEDVAAGSVKHGRPPARYERGGQRFVVATLRMAQGAPAGSNLVPLANELKQFELPRPIFTESEKTEWAPGVYANRHSELQVHVDITKVIKTPGSRPQLEAARGQLTPFLRDSLVGLNYAYYEPPGAQLLHNNPLFVRSHDFSGETIMGVTQLWQAPELFNQGSPAGGGAYLVGSLAELPYVLATTEEDFIAPKNVQALIWKEVTADLLVSGALPSAMVSTPYTLKTDQVHAG